MALPGDFDLRERDCFGVNAQFAVRSLRPNLRDGFKNSRVRNAAASARPKPIATLSAPRKAKNVMRNLRRGLGLPASQVGGIPRFHASPYFPFPIFHDPLTTFHLLSLPLALRY